jgi:voltage-gated potassium channel
VISHGSIGHDRVLSLAVDMAFLVLAGASTTFAFRGRPTWRRWLGLARDLAIALPLWTILNVESTPHWWLWAGKILALLYLGRLAALLTRIDALPPSAGRLLLLAVVMPLCVWWAATGWLVLGGDSGTTDARMRLVRAIYWAIATLATVGYGDIVATTIPQMLYACCIMISGVAFFGYVLSNIATLMLRLDAAKQHQEEMRDRVEYFMHYHAVPPALRQRVRAYFKYLWSSRHGYDDVEVFESLPPNLRADLALHLHRDLLAKVPVLKGASPEVIRDLVITLRPMVCVPGDIVCRKGAPGDEMYFIVHGEVEVVDENDGVLARLHDGDFFGEMALLTDNPRNATARTASFCDLYVLGRETFKQVAARHPVFHSSIDEKARHRLSTATLPTTL